MTLLRDVYALVPHAVPLHRGRRRLERLKAHRQRGRTGPRLQRCKQTGPLIL